MSQHQTKAAVRDYNLDATLTSGQAFRWQRRQGGWEGVIGSRWVRLQSQGGAIWAETAEPTHSWAWLDAYLQTPVDLDEVLASFPTDVPLQTATKACRGLRLLRQDPWECLASFILSSAKQILQIQQVVARLCERWGEPVAVPAGHAGVFSFPSARRLARCSEADLRACQMGFRAPFLKATATLVAEGRVPLAEIARLPLGEARSTLMRLPGVGRKIADCVLLFGFGFTAAFPIDVWVAKALRQYYFPRQRLNLAQLQRFAEIHFGPYAGYAQQYLFHYERNCLCLKHYWHRIQPCGKGGLKYENAK